jgi:integrase
VTEPRRQRRPRRKTLTDKMVAALPRRPTPYFHGDPELPKHGIRVRPAGPCSYTVITRDPYHKQRWVKVGSVAEMTITEARVVARTVIRRVEAGLAPFEAPQQEPESVAAVAGNWLARHVDKNRLRTAAELRRHVEKYVLPHWAERAFVDIKRRDIAELLDHIEDAHGPAMADAVLSTLRSIATWVQSRDDSYTPPFTKGMRRVPAQARKRARILDDAELRAVWLAAAEAGTYGHLIRLLLLTAQRREKVLSMRWSDIDADGVWTIPTSPREKGTPGSLKLPAQALAIIRALPRFVGNDYLFAGGRGRRALALSHLKADFDRRSGVSNWRLHDLRRTARSLMSRAGVLGEHAERVLGHTITGVAGVYDRHSYHSEKAAALTKLEMLIERIVNGPSDNVLRMHEAAS